MSASVGLFLDRAQAVQPDFELTDENANSIGQICIRLGGLPLAIELAAPWIKVLPTETILTRLKHSLELLDSRIGRSTVSQRSLRASLDWSHDLLSSNEQVLFRRLSVFASGWTLDAAEEVCSFGELEPAEVLPLLSTLINNSLVTTERRDSGLRYRFLETIREYALEKIEDAKEATECKVRHLAWYTALGEQADSGLTGRRQLSWLDELDAEHPNILQALGFACTLPADLGSSLQDECLREGLVLVVSLHRFWMIRAHVKEAYGTIAQLLAIKPLEEPSYAKALSIAAQLALLTGDAISALELAERAISLSRQLGDTGQLVLALSTAGASKGNSNRVAEALADLDEAAALANDQPKGLLLQLNYMRLVMCLAMKDPRVDDLLADALLALEDGDIYAEGWIAQIGGQIAFERGDPSTAEGFFRRSLTLWSQLQDTNGMAIMLELLGWTAIHTGRLSRGVQLLAAAGSARQARGRALYPLWKDAHDAELELARAGLAEPAFELALETGGALSIETAAALALDQGDLPQGASVTLGQGRWTMPITRREFQIASLISSGQSNREIADHLVVSERTVDAHVSNILRKLNFRSRSQIAAWVASWQHRDEHTERR